MSGLAAAATATAEREAMSSLPRRARPAPVAVAGADADCFELPDGGVFAVSAATGLGGVEAVLGFAVADLELVPALPQR